MTLQRQSGGLDGVDLPLDALGLLAIRHPDSSLMQRNIIAQTEPVCTTSPPGGLGREIASGITA